MTDDSRILRVLLIPLVLVVLFFAIAPKMLGPRPKTALAANDGVPAPESPKHPSSEAMFPEGLDAAHIQYLIEIDPAFATPMTATATRLIVPYEPDVSQSALV